MIALGLKVNFGGGNLDLLRKLLGAKTFLLILIISLGLKDELDLMVEIVVLNGQPH